MLFEFRDKFLTAALFFNLEVIVLSFKIIIIIKKNKDQGVKLYIVHFYSICFDPKQE